MRVSVFRKTNFCLQDYLGRMVRILFLRDCDAICEIEWMKERKKERILESEVMEEEVILWNVSLLQKS